MINIPQHFHQIWIGSNEMPLKFSAFQAGWIKKHPGWQMTTWNESSIISLKYYDQELTKLLKNYAEISDYLRYIILLEHGGVYLDTDFECLKSIDFLIKSIDFFIGAELDNTLNNAIIGSVPQHFLLKELVSTFPCRIRETSNKGKYFSNEKLGPLYVEKFIYDHGFQNKIKIFPAIYFYPIHHKYFSEGHLYLKSPNIDSSYGIHHYTGHWISPWKKLRRRIYNLHPAISISYNFLKRKLHIKL